VTFPRQPSRDSDSGDPATDPDAVTRGEDSALHVASAQDQTIEHGRDDLLGEILHRADARDVVAQCRDLVAAERVPGDESQAALDRVWAARDRDAAAVDRADIIDVLRQGAAPVQSRQ
jgi:hypothetical protein